MLKKEKEKGINKRGEDNYFLKLIFNNFIMQTFMETKQQKYSYLYIYSRNIVALCTIKMEVSCKSKNIDIVVFEEASQIGTTCRYQTHLNCIIVQLYS